MNKMTTEKLNKDRVEIAKQSLERRLSAIKVDLYNIKESESEPSWYAHYFKILKNNVKCYNEETEDMKNNFGIEFSDLQNEYEAMFSQINKYLNPAEVKAE